MNRTISTSARRSRFLVRAVVPLGIVAVVAFAVGMLISRDSAELEAVDRFAAAWAEGDYEAMHAELTPGASGETTVEELQAAYEKAADTATATGLAVGDSRGPLEQDGETVVALEATVSTSAFGELGGEVAVPVAEDAVEWRPEMVFPGLLAGEELDRKTILPKRAPILAADRSPLAEGPLDARVTSGAGGIVTGEISEPGRPRQKELEALGFPEGTTAGTSGLELAFDAELAGTPGGELLAKGGEEERVLASSEPVEGESVRTTIDPKLQDATAAALGSTYGGAALIDAKNGDVLALAGLAFSAPQPPGSVMKVITLTGALNEGITKPEEEFPVVTSAIVGGREIFNADDAACGGNLITSFAKSCNSVFGPLGEELGGKRLVEVSEKFGFNAPPSLYRTDALAAVEPAESTIPQDLADSEAGVSAIGQGEVLATPLEMASTSQAIANGGVRSPTSIVRDPELAGDYPDVTVTDPETAKVVRDMMIEVVKSGTGIAAALPDVTVAGKTGTAELGTTSGEPIGDAEAEQDVDAWFTAFAPAEKPKYAVAVMVINADGGGGAIAAPIARAILDAAL